MQPLPITTVWLAQERTEELRRQAAVARAPRHARTSPVRSRLRALLGDR
jgi:hypothetical protein